MPLYKNYAAMEKANIKMKDASNFSYIISFLLNQLKQYQNQKDLGSVKSSLIIKNIGI